MRAERLDNSSKTLKMVPNRIPVLSIQKQRRENLVGKELGLTGSYDKKGIPVHAVGTIEDITSQKRMEHDLIAEAEHGRINRIAQSESCHQQD